MKNLIGISGRIGSGKDTVGTIIQYLQEEDEWNNFSDFVCDPAFGEWEIRKFADKLKDIVCMLIGCTREQLEDTTFKNTPMNSNWDDSHGINTPRELLQILGTNCGRDMIHPNIWVNSLFVDYKPLDDTLRSSMGNVIDYSACPYPNWIITDLRFPNELDAIKKRNGITIRVNRQTHTIGGKVILHDSETALDDATFDYVINNDGTISDLIEEVRRILIAEQII